MLGSCGWGLNIPCPVDLECGDWLSRRGADEAWNGMPSLSTPSSGGPDPMEICGPGGRSLKLGGERGVQSRPGEGEFPERAGIEGSVLG